MQVQNTDNSKAGIETDFPAECHRTMASSEEIESSDAPRTIVEFLEVSPNIPFNDWPNFPNPFKHPLDALKWLFRTLFSLVALIGLLAAIAAVPVLSILVLGFLLEVEGRVVRSGRFRDAFPLLPLAPRIGSIAVGVGIWLIPLFFLAGLAADVALTDISQMA